MCQRTAMNICECDHVCVCVCVYMLPAFVSYPWLASQNHMSVCGAVLTCATAGGQTGRTLHNDSFIPACHALQIVTSCSTASNEHVGLNTADMQRWDNMSNGFLLVGLNQKQRVCDFVQFMIAGWSAVKPAGRWVVAEGPPGIWCPLLAESEGDMYCRCLITIMDGQFTTIEQTSSIQVCWPLDQNLCMKWY